jgi:hypothetical protein
VTTRRCGTSAGGELRHRGRGHGRTVLEGTRMHLPPMRRADRGRPCSVRVCSLSRVPRRPGRQCHSPRPELAGRTAAAQRLRAATPAWFLVALGALVLSWWALASRSSARSGEIGTGSGSISGRRMGNCMSWRVALRTNQVMRQRSRNACGRAVAGWVACRHDRANSANLTPGPDIALSRGETLRVGRRR